MTLNKKNRTLKNILKRDGTIEKFNTQKIAKAITKVGKLSGEFDEKVAKKLTVKIMYIAQNMDFDNLPTANDIAEIVEEVLMNTYKTTAKTFILYRDQQERFHSFTINEQIKLVNKYVKKDDWKVNENSNMAYSLQGLHNYISSEISQNFWLRSIYPKLIRDAHISGDFHIHDLSSISNYCNGWDLHQLLLEGFCGVENKIESKPAKHFRSILGQLVNFFYSLQGECYSKDTEVLTNNGWKHFYELNTKKDLVATRKLYTKEFTFEPIKKYIEYDYNGKLLHFKNPKVGLMVTPNHRMLVSNLQHKESMVLAENIKTYHSIPTDSIWQGKEKKYFTLPTVTKKHYSGYTKKYIIKKVCSKKIKMDVWLKFFGLFISEGGIGKRKRKNYIEYDVSIFQKKYVKEVIEVLDELNFNYSIKLRNGKFINKEKLLQNLKQNKLTFYQFIIYNKQLGMYLEQFGKSKDKFIPKEIKNLSIRQLKILYKYLYLGDGLSNTSNGNEEYYTASIQLANDVQEIICKLGCSSRIKSRTKYIEKYNKTYIWYIVKKYNSKQRWLSKNKKEDIELIDYKDKVYCVTVDSGIILVRRNKITNWCGNSAGALAFSSFDTLLAPFIYYDKLSYKEVKQAIQECIFNLNVPTRVGFQTPFTNITLDLEPSSNYAKQQVVIGGELKDKTYGEFQKEMDIINKAFCEVMLEGDAKGRVFSFPIPTYNITKQFNWDNENLDLLWEMTAKYGIPYFANYINSDMSPEDARSLCCRLRLDTRALKKRGGGLFGAHPLTGSVGIVTINMPRLGYISKNSEEFFKKLEHLLILAKDSLEIKRNMIEQFTDEGLYPYTKFYLRGVKKRFDKYWVNHFSTIGLVGLNEGCLNLFGEDIGTKKGLAFSVKVLNFMRDKMLQFQKETGNNFNLEATPSEGTCYSLALKDKKKYPNIIVANEESYRGGGAPYYSNSSNLPVSYTDDVFEALDHQDNLQPLYTGGTVHHLFLGERVDDIEALKKLIKTICINYKVPYISISPTFSVCPLHGYISGEHEYCPKCDEILLAEIERGEHSGT